MAWMRLDRGRAGSRARPVSPSQPSRSSSASSGSSARRGRAASSTADSSARRASSSSLPRAAFARYGSCAHPRAWPIARIAVARSAGSPVASTSPAAPSCTASVARSSRSPSFALSHIAGSRSVAASSGTSGAGAEASPPACLAAVAAPPPGARFSHPPQVANSDREHAAAGEQAGVRAARASVDKPTGLRARSATARFLGPVTCGLAWLPSRRLRGSAGEDVERALARLLVL